MTIEGLELFATYMVSSIAMLVTFTYLYMKVTPYNDLSLIRDGKVAPGIVLFGAMIGFTIPIVTMSYHGASYLDYLVWSIIAGLLQLACFKVVYWLMPKEVEADNVATSLFYAGISICVGLINAFSMIP